MNHDQKIVEEAKMAFNTLYMPVAIANNRLNGEDFFKVAIEIMNEAKRNKVSETDKEIIAKTLISEFNSKLNPKMDDRMSDSLLKLLTGNSTIQFY